MLARNSALLRTFSRRLTSSSMASTGDSGLSTCGGSRCAAGFLGNKQFFLTRAGALNVDGREDALVDELAVKNDFHVAGALELFEDDFVHAGAGIDEAVAMMVSEPPSSMLRAAPKKRLGAASMDQRRRRALFRRRDDGVVARARRVLSRAG